MPNWIRAAASGPGNFSDTANWAGGTLPTSADDATFPNGPALAECVVDQTTDASFNVAVPSQAITLSAAADVSMAIAFNATATNSTLTVQAGATWTGGMTISTTGVTIDIDPAATVSGIWQWLNGFGSPTFAQGMNVPNASLFVNGASGTWVMPSVVSVAQMRVFSGAMVFDLATNNTALTVNNRLMPRGNRFLMGTNPIVMDSAFIENQVANGHTDLPAIQTSTRFQYYGTLNELASLDIQPGGTIQAQPNSQLHVVGDIDLSAAGAQFEANNQAATTLSTDGQILLTDESIDGTTINAVGGGAATATDFANVDASGGAAIDATDPSNTDSGGNTNVVFASAAVPTNLMMAAGPLQ